MLPPLDLRWPAAFRSNRALLQNLSNGHRDLSGGGGALYRIFAVAVVLAIVGVAEAGAAVWLGLARGPVRGFMPYDGIAVAKDLAFALFLVMAAVIARRQPRNRYWMLLAAAGSLDISFPSQYTAFGVSHGGSLPAIPLVAWLCKRSQDDPAGAHFHTLALL